LFFTVASAGAQGSGSATPADSATSWSFSVAPEFTLPLGSDAEVFGLGGGAALAATLRIPSLPLLYTGANFGYSFLSSKAPDTSLSVVDLGARVGLNLQLSRALTLRAVGEGGYFYAAMNGGGSEPGYNPYFAAGAELGYALSPNLSLSLGASYRGRLALSNELVAGLGLSYRIGSETRAWKAPEGFVPLEAPGRGLGFVGVKLDSVFPIFYKHYDDHEIGSIVVRNFEAAGARDVKVLVEVKRYMDEPKQAAFASELKSGTTAEAKLLGLFNDRILEVVEATKLPVSVKLQYTQFGKSVEEEYVGTLDVLDRNAITWDDDRKAAAFASSKDPSALAFAKSVAVSVKDLQNAGVSQNLQAAMAVHEALRVQGLAYVKDPSSALETNDKKVVDFILFPQQTLAYNSGKCGDLTVLYCSLLEAIGVPTALITVPGHILMAVDLEMSPDQAARTFARPGDLIMKDGTAWLPIETTLRKEGFAAAWQEGARQWRDASAKDKAAFYPVREAWKEYQPVAIPGIAAVTSQKSPKAAAAAFKAELSSFVEAETGPRVAVILAEMKKSGQSAALYNKLGVLYARYGMLDKAQEQFAAALKGKDPGSAVFNMGNILFVQGKYADALGYYNRALAASPNDPNALLSVARANAALGKYAAALDSYNKLKAADSKLADKYAYLGGGDAGVRAAEASAERSDLSWKD
jgi:TolA-binding protein